MCVNCGQNPGVGRTCLHCRQVTGLAAGLRTSSGGKRFGGFVLDVVLVFATLVIGYLIWALFLLRGGRSPAKQLLGMRAIKTKDYRPSGFWRTWWRDIARGLVMSIWVFGWVLAFWLLWDDDNQELWDKMAGTIVVDWPKGVPVPSVEPSPGEPIVAAAPGADPNAAW
jgi:uncharacterized RDD family membrane protein YckC